MRFHCDRLGIAAGLEGLHQSGPLIGAFAESALLGRVCTSPELLQGIDRYVLRTVVHTYRVLRTSRMQDLASISRTCRFLERPVFLWLKTLINFQSGLVLIDLFLFTYPLYLFRSCARLGTPQCNRTSGTAHCSIGGPCSRTALATLNEHYHR